ncbi:protein FAM3C-like isoform X2 [Chaetodon trifascialis]|uniref:protein FAM3C-like isoform X2 n=1 Tax=Chaetodon trifascialis TaxID=109706 RepID=UPI0039945532
MLTVRVGKIKMARRQHFRGWLLHCVLVLVPLVVFVTLILQKFSNPFTDDLRLSADVSSQISKAPSKLFDGSSVMKIDCPEDQFSFYIQSGAANVVAPKIYVQNKLVLGTWLNNAGYGINIVVMDGKKGDILKTAHFDMYSGDVNPLIDFLRSIESGSVVLMASYDEPSSKLNEDARKLIAELGSSAVQSLGFRDNWVFVGGKGAAVKNNFEKHLKSDSATNKYENWPELIELQGCIPKYLE